MSVYIIKTEDSGAEVHVTDSIYPPQPWLSIIRGSHIEGVSLSVDEARRIALALLESIGEPGERISDAPE